MITLRTTIKVYETIKS